MKKKCLIKECHAACCYNIPMEKGYVSAYRKRIVNPIIRMELLGDDDYAKEKGLGRAHYLMVTDNEPSKNKCPFLREDCKCNIYEQRPVICRRFGNTPNERFLQCMYLDK